MEMVAEWTLNHFLPNSPPQHARRLEHEGSEHLKRFEQTRSLDDLERGIAACNDAVKLLDNPEFVDLQIPALRWLSRAWRWQYDITSTLSSLDQAIQTSRDAVAVDTKNEVEDRKCLMDLAQNLIKRYEISPTPNDLDEAWEVGWKGMQPTQTTDGVPTESILFVGNILRLKYEATNDETYAARAISMLEFGLRNVPSDSQWKEKLDAIKHLEAVRSRMADNEELDRMSALNLNDGSQENVNHSESPRGNTDTPAASNGTATGSPTLTSPLYITMCRYVTNNLERASISLYETEYLAVSHVWGDAQWNDVPGIEGDVLASEEKARFIGENLKGAVGRHWFWMDILCLDQRDSEVKTMITQHIPNIFRFAKRTIVIRESKGCRQCCWEAFSEKDRKELDTGPFFPLKNFRDHIFGSHRNENLLEGVFTRLWPREEILLSNDIQFIRCLEEAYTNTEPSTDMDKTVEDPTTWNALGQSLGLLATAWVRYGELENRASTSSFVRAYFSCGSASRERTSNIDRPPFPTRSELSNLSTQARRTGKSRDFILGIMPQYAFYTVPRNAKSMKFAELLVDCFSQLRRFESHPYYDLGPLLRAESDSRVELEVSANIPEPIFLADAMKFFLGPSHLTALAYPVSVQYMDDLTLNELKYEIQNSLELVDGGGLTHAVSELAELPKTAHILGSVEEIQLVRFFAAEMYNMITHVKAEGYKPQEPLPLLQYLASSGIMPEILVRMIAMCMCEIGLSGLQWSYGALVPVFVLFRGRRMLAMIPKSLLGLQHNPSFCLVESERHYRYMLLAVRPKEGGGSVVTPCLFPEVHSPRFTNYFEFWNNGPQIETRKQDEATREKLME